LTEAVAQSWARQQPFGTGWLIARHLGADESRANISAPAIASRSRARLVGSDGRAGSAIAMR
jgi:hypothetical protein